MQVCLPVQGTAAGKFLSLGNANRDRPLSCDPSLGLA